MGLQSMEAGELLSRWRVYPAADVDALIARIRAAVEAERGAPPCRCTSLPHLIDCEFGRAYNALDALLSHGECSSLCAPGSGERCMVTDSGRCPEGGA